MLNKFLTFSHNVIMGAASKGFSKVYLKITDFIFEIIGNNTG